MMKVAMRNPLKQGLKLKFVSSSDTGINIVAMRNPLKQGLKRDVDGIDTIGIGRRNAKSTKTRIETPHGSQHTVV